MTEVLSSFTIWDVALWLAGSSLIMLVASEVLAPYVSKRNIVIEVKKLRSVAIVFAIAFLLTVGIRVISITYH